MSTPLCGADIVATCSGAHTHTITVTAADIAAGVAKAYESSVSTHSHWVSLTPADFDLLKAGMEVKKRSCSGGDHEWVFKCGGGGSPPGTPVCDATPDCGNAMNNTCN